MTEISYNRETKTIYSSNGTIINFNNYASTSFEGMEHKYGDIGGPCLRIQYKNGGAVWIALESANEYHQIRNILKEIL